MVCTQDELEKPASDILWNTWMCAESHTILILNYCQIIELLNAFICSTKFTVVVVNKWIIKPSSLFRDKFIFKGGEGKNFQWQNFFKQNSRIFSFEYLFSEILLITCNIYVLKKLIVIVTLCILFTNKKNIVSAVDFTYHKITWEGDHCF